MHGRILQGMLALFFLSMMFGCHEVSGRVEVETINGRYMGLKDVCVRVYGDGQLVDTTYTNESGDFQFLDLPSTVWRNGRVDIHKGLNQNWSFLFLTTSRMITNWIFTPEVAFRGIDVVGYWQMNAVTEEDDEVAGPISFYQDGTCYANGREGDWAIESNKLFMDIESERFSTYGSMQYSFPGFLIGDLSLSEPLLAMNTDAGNELRSFKAAQSSDVKATAEMTRLAEAPLARQ